MTPIIEVKGLSKKYRIGENQPYITLRDTLAEVIKNPFGKIKEGLRKDEFWALKDINFTVEPGEVVGIIGRNGAGKSTLLKILSRITPPSEGEVIMRGRVGSLLEVGTGFQQELTGRENIFLNGAILGMTQREIRRKFDEIVDFAEVEKFIDTPVKHYSSGMYMRLAFSIAAHLDPEILIVDEVLAVGDAEFQKKCLGKMDEVSKKQGKTILFVSHNLTALQSICRSGVILSNGIATQKSDIGLAIKKYQGQMIMVNKVNSPIWTNKKPKNSLDVYINKIQIINNGNIPETSFLNTEDILVQIDFEVINPNRDLKIGFELLKHGLIIFQSNNTDNGVSYFEPGSHQIRCKIPSKLLNIGQYEILPKISIHGVKDIFKFNKPVLAFNINIDRKISKHHLILNEKNNPGMIFPILEWTKVHV